jgi:hypothetical protein
MKHVWVVESSGGRKWRPAGSPRAESYFTKKVAESRLNWLKENSPGLKWRVAKYARGGGE